MESYGSTREKRFSTKTHRKLALFLQESPKVSGNLRELAGGCNLGILYSGSLSNASMHGVVFIPEEKLPMQLGRQCRRERRQPAVALYICVLHVTIIILLLLLIIIIIRILPVRIIAIMCICSMYVCMCVCVYIYIYIHTCMYRKRERERHVLSQADLRDLQASATRAIPLFPNHTTTTTTNNNNNNNDNTNNYTFCSKHGQSPC